MTGHSAASAVSARLFCRTGRLAGMEHRIHLEATIGRGAESDVAVPDAVVSKRHARIAFDPQAGSYVLEDLRSRNGTLLDGLAVAGPVALGSLHVITLGGQHDFLFVALPAGAGLDGDTGAAAEDAPTSDASTASDASTRFAALSSLHAPRLTEEAAPAAAGPNEAGTVHEPASLLRLPVLTDTSADEASSTAAGNEAGTSLEPPSAPRGSGPAAPSAPSDSPAPGAVPPTSTVALDAARAAAGFVALDVTLPGGACRRVELPDGRHVVGRSPTCDIPIDDRALSREHAVFVVQAGAVRVEDLDSTNGTCVEGEPVRMPVSVAIGQRVTLGDRVAVVLVRAGREKQGG